MKRVMKKNYERIETILFLSVIMLVMIMAAGTAYSYAKTYYGDLDEGVNTSVSWGGTYDPNAITYFRIQPSKKGTITFTADFACWVTLCDDKYNELSKGYYNSGDRIDPNNTSSFMQKVHYGVKANKTYNLKLVNMPPAANKDSLFVGVVKYTNAKVKTAKYGSSKKKAKAIKKNKKIKGLFVAGNKKAQWYKVTNKQKKTKITISADKINYALNIKVYYKDGKKWKNASTQLTWQTDYKKDTFQGTINKKAKHTYYIKVSPEGKTSGSYTIKWS